MTENYIVEYCGLQWKQEDEYSQDRVLVFNMINSCNGKCGQFLVHPYCNEQQIAPNFYIVTYDYIYTIFCQDKEELMLFKLLHSDIKYNIIEIL